MTEKEERGPDRGISNRDTHWHMDKRVPMALIFAIFLQTVGAVWWAATINASVAQNEGRLMDIKKSEEELRKLSDRMIRFEFMIDGVKKTLARIDRRLLKRQKR